MHFTDNMAKLKLSYDLYNVQGIKVGPTSKVVVPHPNIISTSITTPPISATETTCFFLEVDQLGNVVADLTLKDMPSSPILTKRSQDEGNPSFP